MSEARLNLRLRHLLPLAATLRAGPQVPQGLQALDEALANELEVLRQLLLVLQALRALA